MAKIRTYDIYIAGSTKLKSIEATCITRACKMFVETLEKAAKYELYNREHAAIRFTDNYSVCSDFVVMEA